MGMFLTMTAWGQEVSRTMELALHPVLGYSNYYGLIYGLGLSIDPI